MVGSSLQVRLEIGERGSVKPSAGFDRSLDLVTVPAPGSVGSPPTVVRGLLGRWGGISQVTQFRSRNRFQSDGFKLSRLVEAVMMITGECRSGTVWGNVSATRIPLCCSRGRWCAERTAWRGSWTGTRDLRWRTSSQLHVRNALLQVGGLAGTLRLAS